MLHAEAAEPDGYLSARSAAARGLIPRGQIKPSSEDYAAIQRSHPDLVRLADRSNPHLSGSN
jgi:hypothetical protein